MSKLFVFLGLAITGCGTQSGGTEPMFVTIDASAAPSTRVVEVFFAFGAPSSIAIATPDILAGTAPPATTAMTWARHVSVQAGYHGQPVEISPGAAPSHPMYVGVIGLGETSTSGAWSGPIDDPEEAMVELKLDPALVPEAWGTQATTGRCFRLNTGAATVFITHPEDPDCDGLTGAQDTQPDAYCDPKATSGPAADACH